MRSKPMLALLPILVTCHHKEFMWKGEGNRCSGPPSLLTVYDIETTIPPLYDYWFQEFELPICGSNPLLIQEGCCLASVSLEYSYGYGSAMFSFTDSLEWPPFESAKYCIFHTNDTHQFVIQDGGCHMGLQCMQNNTLIEYSDPQCLHILYYHDTTPVEVTGGHLETKWIATVSSDGMVPTFKYPAEWIGVICISLALLIATLMTLYYLVTLAAIPEASVPLAIAKALCMCFVIMRLCYWVIIYSDMISWVMVEWVENSATNISTLVSSFTTMNVLIRYFHVTNPQTIRLWKTLLVMLNIALAGNGYFVYWKYYGNYTVEMLKWNRARPAWKLFVYLFNTIPPIYIFSKLWTVKREKRDSPLKPDELESYFSFLLGAQIMNTGFQVLTQYVTIYSDLLFTDENILAMCGPDSLFDVLNYFITYLLNFNLLQMMHAHVHPNSKRLRLSRIFRKRIREIFGIHSLSEAMKGSSALLAGNRSGTKNTHNG